MGRTKRCLLWLILMSSFFMLAIGENQASANFANIKLEVHSPDPEDQKELQDIDPPIAHPTGPTGYQKVVKVFEGTKRAKPGVYWYQIDTLEWRQTLPLGRTS